MTVIQNLPDAITAVVEDMKASVVNTIPVSVVGSVTTYTYSTENNIYVAGMWVEFDFIEAVEGDPNYEDQRYKIATLTKNSANSYTITINTGLTLIHGKSNVQMFPFILFKYDNYKNIQKQLIEASKGTLKNNQYPLLVLQLPYSEDRDSENGILFESDANLTFIVDTEKNWTTEDRLTYSFKQKLYPLYNLFIEKLKLSYLFQHDTDFNIPHTKVDRYHWSADAAETQNKIAGIVDAIEITSLNLILNKQSNC